MVELVAVQPGSCCSTEATDVQETVRKRYAGALTRDQFAAGLDQAGFEDIEITETHRVHEQAASAIVRARLAG